MRHSLFWTLGVIVSASALAGTYRDLAMRFVKEQRSSGESSACAMTTADSCDSAGKRYALLTNWVQKVDQWRHDEIKKSDPSYFTGASVLSIDEMRRAETQAAIDAVNLRNWSKSVGEAVTRASGGSSGLWAGDRVMNGVLVKGVSRWLGLTDNPEMSIEGNIHACAMKRLKTRLDLISCSDEVSWFSIAWSHISVSNDIAFVESTLVPSFPLYKRVIEVVKDALSDVSVENGERTIRVEDYLSPRELSKEFDKAYEKECDRLSRLPNRPRFLTKSSMKGHLNYPKVRIHEYKVSNADFDAICQWCQIAKEKPPHVVSLEYRDDEYENWEEREITKLGVFEDSIHGGRILPLSMENGILVVGLPRGPHGTEFVHSCDYDNSVVLPGRFKIDNIDLSRYKLKHVRLQYRKE